MHRSSAAAAMAEAMAEIIADDADDFARRTYEHIDREARRARVLAGLHERINDANDRNANPNVVYVALMSGAIELARQPIGTLMPTPNHPNGLRMVNTERISWKATVDWPIITHAAFVTGTGRVLYDADIRHGHRVLRAGDECHFEPGALAVNAWPAEPLPSVEPEPAEHACAWCSEELDPSAEAFPWLNKLGAFARTDNGKTAFLFLLYTMATLAIVVAIR